MKLSRCRTSLSVCSALVLVILSTPAPFRAQAVMVTLTEPSAGATYTSGDAITIRWDAFNDDPVDHYRIAASTDGSTWTVITDTEPRASRAFTWDNAGPPSDTSRVRIEARTIDGGVLASDETSTFAIRPGPAGSLPWPWVSKDVGAVGAPGSASYEGGTFTVRGSGADIWGTQDEFHFAYVTRDGDFDIEARVTGVDNVDEWTKAGLMVRDVTGALAAHASLFATPTTVKGISYQTRNHEGDTSLERRRISSVAPPVWVKLMRRGGAVQAAYRRTAADAWTLMPTVGVHFSHTVQVGLAVSSHVDGTVASATFTDVRIVDIPTVVVWTPADKQVLTASEPFRIRWELTAGEAQQWSVSFSPNSFDFFGITECASLPGESRECTWRNPGPATEQGLIRVTARNAAGEILDVGHSGTFSIRIPPGAPRVTILQPRADDEIFAKQPYRIMWDAADDTGLAEFDVQLRRAPDGAFAPIAECTNVPGDRRECTWNIPDVSGPHEIRVIATDVEGLQAEALSGVFHLESTTRPIPPPWTCGDVGAVGAAGACRGISGEDYEQIEVDGSGADIWGTADEFSFARQEVDGNFAITVRVNQVDNVHRWTKAGIMIRDWNNGDPGAPHASLFATPTAEKGTAFQRRATRGGVSVSSAGITDGAPTWLRLARVGNFVWAHVRKQTTDPWFLVGFQEFATLPTRLTVALVVSSHVDGTLATANFESMIVDQTEPLQSIDIGGASPGHAETDHGTLKIRGDGADIWGTADSFRFTRTAWTGNGTIIARVVAIDEGNEPWTKAGVMIRESDAPGSKHVMAIVSLGKGISMQYRSTTGGTSREAVRTVGTAPVWLRLTRDGDRISTFYSVTPELSPDGHIYTWEPLGEVTVSMNANAFIGLAITSHSPGSLARAIFDDLFIRP